MFYYKERYIRLFDLKSHKDIPLTAVRRPGSVASNNTPRVLMYNSMNPAEHNILLCSQSEGGSYELFTLKKNDAVQDDSQTAMRGMGLAAVFTSRTRIAVLDNAAQISLKNLQNETKRKISLPFSNANFIFPAQIGHVLVRAADAMYLFELEGRKVINKLNTLVRHPIKYVSWSKNHKYVALLSKFLIYICDNQLKELCMINETSRIKSACWDPSGVLIYTTASHIKFCLSNGDNGVIRTLDVPIYMIGINGSALSCIDRELKTREIQLDSTEYMFKFSLMHRRYGDALKIMQTNKLVGQAIIAYLHKKGFPEVALHFVQDPKTKFALSLECGNIKVALECAKELNQPECWHKLGVEALRQGHHQTVEMAYQKTKNFERLSFLYLICGNMEKLSKMLNIAQLRQDVMGRFHNSLYLGQVE
jgi:coatomer protein complex subunit alpha (xenin)